MKRTATLALAAAVLAIASTPTTAAVKPIRLELKVLQKPAVPRPEMAELLTAGPITLEVTDARHGADLAVVGSQQMEGEDVYVWRTEAPVAATVETFVRQVLESWSVHVASEAPAGLRLALLDYFVDERSEKFGSTYVARVRFGVGFVEKGIVSWTGEANGGARRSGVDARASMCNEALSFALRRALAQALSSIKPGDSRPAAADAEAAPPAAPAPIVIEPDALFADLARLKDGGMAEDVLVAYIEQRKLSRPLTVDEILRWKNAGIPDAAIRAATRLQ